MASFNAGLGQVTATATALPEEIPGAFVAIDAGYERPQIDEEPADLPKRSLLLPVAIILVGLIAAAAVAAYISKNAKSAPAFEDLGAGISNSTGLRGNLQVRWQGSGQYQVKFEPIDPLQSSGFSYVAANPRGLMSINIRILDATGFALCNKEVWFPSTGGATGDGKDVFQNAKGETGKVTSFSAQGLLPCTEDQFRQASYWDFNTNFPTLAEQDSLMRHTATEKARKEAARLAMERRSGSSFTAEGYDGATGYDETENVLETRLGRNFVVARATDRSAASAWAESNSLFHYKCDQRSRCALTQAGGGSTIYVTAMQ
jgi:hypothetical protein